MARTEDEIPGWQLVVGHAVSRLPALRALSDPLKFRNAQANAAWTPPFAGDLTMVLACWIMLNVIGGWSFDIDT